MADPFKKPFAVPAPRTKKPTTSVPEVAISEQQQSQPQPPPLKYDKPSWGAVACFDYSLEVLKGGVSIDKIQGPRKDVITIGRLPLCDIIMEHPSLSRYHAVIQFNEEGQAFLYDLDSSYGCQLNKKKIPPRTYEPLHTGDQIRFGESTRLYIFETEKPRTDDELEEEEEILLRHRTRAADVEHVVESDQDEGINWGFQEDAVEEEDQEEVDEKTGDIRQPTTGDAQLLSLESEKMAIADAKRRRKDLEIMFGDDDSEEELYDKTDTKKRKAIKKEKKAETHEDLIKQQQETEKRIKIIQEKLEKRKLEDEDAKGKSQAGNDEDLDTYMDQLNKTSKEKSTSIYTLQKELKRLEKVRSCSSG
ncbi:SMAD/FHA domain-containing protein [Halteromyces radiatus]|uniref:SMAD/FHA domain-containing protein n=1 Tax=Halteromyces radiatus TaxID=101107 RepID=UPI002220CFB8|nr:SMAD/FHA domain-containing protein [Halteromyces radiatus]KAI8098837.1 SMAD/FHA domain-containing protein [Halteromyces radiatus]